MGALVGKDPYRNHKLNAVLLPGDLQGGGEQRGPGRGVEEGGGGQHQRGQEAAPGAQPGEASHQLQAPAGRGREVIQQRPRTHYQRKIRQVCSSIKYF